MHFASLRRDRDDYTFRMDCPYCELGTLLININPVPEACAGLRALLGHPGLPVRTGLLLPAHRRRDRSD